VTDPGVHASVELGTSLLVAAGGDLLSIPVCVL
jgi:hypothetical protein